ncbi:MAG: indolepyruvate oxidoreductase subunit beta [archaeon]|nr:indolepyruvate oxidoreductase subunit beta [archaeon]
MRAKNFNMLSVGVGGQGVIRASQMLIWGAFEDGQVVRTTETHGMAQRGGSVAGFLRFGSDVMSPMTPRGYAHIMISFEPIEAIRYVEYAGPNTFILVNNQIIFPLSIYQKKANTYPKVEDIEKSLKKISKNVFFVDAHDIAAKAGNSQATNVVLLGILSGSDILPISRTNLKKSILRFVPQKAQKINEKAFQMGIDKGQSIKGDIK